MRKEAAIFEQFKQYIRGDRISRCIKTSQRIDTSIISSSCLKFKIRYFILQNERYKRVYGWEIQKVKKHRLKKRLLIKGNRRDVVATT